MWRKIEKWLPWFLWAGLSWNVVLHLTSWAGREGILFGEPLLMLLFVLAGPAIAFACLQKLRGAVLKKDGWRALFMQVPKWLRYLVGGLAAWTVINPFVPSIVSWEASLIGYFLRVVSMFYAMLYAIVLALMWAPVPPEPVSDEPEI